MFPLIRFGVIREAWGLYKRHWVVWSLATLLVTFANSLVTGALVAMLDGGTHPPRHGGFRLFAPVSGSFDFVIFTAVSGFLVGGMIRMAANQLRGGVPRIEDLFSVTDCWFDLLLASVLVGAASTLGAVFFVIPGFIVFGLLIMTIPLVVEGRLPATGAFIQSWQALKSQWLAAALFHPFLLLAAMSGIILCGVGVFFTGPLYSLSVALLYRDFFPGGPIVARHKPKDPFVEI